MFDIRVIDRHGVFHVHHDGDKESARRRALRLAEITWPRDDGYVYKGTGKTSDCISVFRHGIHQGDCAVEPLDEIPGE